MHGFHIFQIWRKYDSDSSGFISAAELLVSVAGNSYWVEGTYSSLGNLMYMDHEFNFCRPKKHGFEFVTLKNVFVFKMFRKYR